MTVLNATQLSDLRETRHHMDVFASFMQPTTLWAARVNNASAEREDQTIPFDSGSGSDFSAIGPHQTVWIGTTAGAKDIGLARIKSISSGDGGVTGTLVVGANPLIWADDLYLTFKHDYRLWAVFPRIAPDETFYKDWDVDGGITYTDQNTNLYPVTIAGPHQANFLSGGSLTFNVPIGDSYTMAPGATIVSRTVTVYPTAGVTVGAFAGGVIPVTYTAPGQYWVKATVTDSNGKSQDTYRAHFVHEDDPNSPHYPFRDFSKLSVSGDWQRTTWEAEFSADDESSLDDIPDETTTVIWQRAYYGDNQRDVSLVDIGSNIIIAGYLVKDSRVNVNLQNGGEVDFLVSTISGIMQNHFMYSVSISSESTVDKWWKFRNDALSTGRALHHLYRWHSTVLHVSDFLRLSEDLSLRKATDIERGGLIEMGQLYSDASRRRVVCDKTGRLHYAIEIALSEDADRAGYDVVAELTEADVVDPLVISRNPQRRVSFVFGSGFSFDGSAATPIGSTAPSKWPSPFGSREVHLERLILNTQSESNELVGQVFARENRVLTEVRAEFTGNYVGALDVAYPEWWTLNVSSVDNVRELTIVNQKIVCRGMTAEYLFREGVVKVIAYFEPEVDGEPGVPYEWPDETPDPGGADPVIPANSITAVMTSTDTNSLFFLGDQDAAWDTRQTWDINHFGKDPFWLTKAPTEFAQDAIIFVCRDGYIGRSTNSGQTFTDVTPATNPPNDYGDAPAPTPADLSYITYKGSLINSGEHCVLAVYQNGDDKWRTWLLFTNDEGSTWSWVSLVSGGGGSGGWSVELSPGEVYDGTRIGDNNHHALSGGIEYLGGDIFGLTHREGSDPEIRYRYMSLATGGTYLSGITIDSGYVAALCRLSDNYHIAALPRDDVSLIQIERVITATGVSTNSISLASTTSAGAIPTGPQATYVIGPIDQDSFFIVFPGGSGGTWVASFTDDGGGGFTQVTEQQIDINDATCVAISKMSDGTSHVYHQSSSGLHVTRMQPGLSGAVSVGTTHLLDAVDADFLSACPVDTEKSVCFFRNNDALNHLHGIVAELTSASGISSGSVTLVQANEVTGTSASSDTGDEATCVFRIDESTQMGIAQVAIGGITGLTPILSDLSGYAWTGGGWPQVLRTGGATIIAGREPDTGVPADNHDDNYRVYSIGAEQTKGIWMDVARGDGSQAYVTAWNGVALSLFNVNLSTLTVNNEYSLGDASESLVFGRMNNPATLGDPVHAMASADGGATFALMNNDLGTDHFGAGVEDAFGLIYLVRNRATQAPQLYDTVPGAPAGVRSTIPIAGSVNPGNITNDFDYSVLILAGEPGGIMVLGAYPPFTSWIDITLNHGTGKSGTAIEVL